MHICRAFCLLATATTLIASGAQARAFPFRIRFLAVDDCQADHAISGTSSSPHVIKDGQCHTEPRGFKKYTMKKNEYVC